jgi:hypothetical protein
MRLKAVGDVELQDIGGALASLTQVVHESMHPVDGGMTVTAFQNAPQTETPCAK